MNFLVFWQCCTPAESITDAARAALEELRTTPEPVEFKVKPDESGAHRVSIVVHPQKWPLATTESGDKLLEDIIQAAAAHGNESEPGHEVGDLQEVLRLCWKYMIPTSREAVHAQLKETMLDTWLMEV